jgi:hypothetical protein
MHTRCLPDNLKGDLDIENNIKMDLKEIGMDSIHLAQGMHLVARCYVYNSEPLDSIKCVEFLDHLSTKQLLEKELFCRVS